MKSFITFNNTKSLLPDNFRQGDVRYPEEFVRYFLELYTKKGDSVIDPFAGFGTTLIVAENMDRVPYGIECEKERYEYIYSKIKHKDNILLANSMEIADNAFPLCDFSISSPPYYPVDPGSRIGEDGSYRSYLYDIGLIYKRVSTFMKKDAYIAIEVSNLKDGDIITLAWDIAKEVSQHLYFEQEIIIGWEGEGSIEGEGSYGRGYDHSYCLIFQNR